MIDILTAQALRQCRVLSVRATLVPTTPGDPSQLLNAGNGGPPTKGWVQNYCRYFKILSVASDHIPMPPNVEHRRIPALDGWRAIAILLVIAEDLQVGTLGRLPFHTGLHGVTLFFVPSGYLITRRSLSEKERTGTINLPAFYWRRFRRLMPAAWTYLLVLLVLLLVAGRAIPVVGFLSALLFFRNYSDPRGLTGHFWSLSIEKQFYLIWPFLLSRMKKETAVVGVIGSGFPFGAWRLSGSLSTRGLAGIAFRVSR